MFYRPLYWPGAGVTITFYTLLLIERLIVGLFILTFLPPLSIGDLVEDGPDGCPWWEPTEAVPEIRLPTLGVWWAAE